MRNASRSAVLLVVFAVAGCASQGSLDKVRTDVDAVKTRLFTMERDLGGLRNESKERLGSIDKDVKAEISAIRKITADIQATTDSNKTEIQALNGRVDDMAASARKPAEELTRYREDADKRIIQLEERLIKLQTAVDALTKKPAEQREGAASPDAPYQKGLELLKSGDMPAARELLQKFIDQNPKHELAANAHYWIGETYYTEKNYEPAILAFQEVIKQFPEKDKVPAAMLKQAMAFKAIQDLKSARYVLKKLGEGFPKSEEARKAKELLKEM